MEIIPAILAKTKEEFTEMVAKVAPHAELVHIDIMDGTVTPDKTAVTPEDLENFDPNLQFELHLMTSQPMMYMTEWLATDAARICVHVEAEDVLEAIERIKSEGRTAGVAVNPKTELDAIREFLPMVDYIQFMTVHPGQYGGEFVAEVLEKIKTFHLGNPGMIIAVDGAIHEGTAQAAVSVGATRLILGSHIFSEGRDIGEAIADLKEKL